MSPTQQKIENIKKSVRNRVLKNNYEISTFMLSAIINKWDENETIMNLTQRIKDVETENGSIKSELNEALNIIQKKNKKIKPMDNSNPIVKAMQNTINEKSKKISELKKQIKDLEYKFKMNQIGNKY